MSRTDADHRDFESLCKKAGWKCTVQRFAVYRFLRGNTTHPGVEAVHKAVRRQIPAISADSVHRILKDFAAAGVIRQMDGLSCLRYDCNPTRHAHFVCLECGKILDIPDSEEIVLPQGCRRFGEIEGLEIRIVGRCRDCMARRAAKPRGKPSLSLSA